MSSSHVGIDIREMMRKTASGTMFGDSLTQRNTAPKFNTKLVARPTSRPQRSSEDISFEAEMEREEAGYKDEHEARSLGHPPLEYWPPKAPETALIRKLVTRETVQKEAHSTIYFSKARECEDKDLSKVKMYTYD